MADPNILNPLENPLFFPILWRTLGVFGVGFLLTWALNKFRFQGLWDTNVGKRYLSWLIMGPIYLFLIFLGGIPSLLFLLAVLFLSIWEIKKITQIPNSYILAFTFLSVFSVIVTSYFPHIFYALPLIYFLVTSSVALKENDAKKSFPHANLSIYVCIWLIFSLSHFVLLGHLNNELDNTKSLLILLGFAIPLSDVFAYVVGRFFTKIGFLTQYKVASNLSPKKTYIGALGNIFGAGIGIGIMYFAIQGYLPWYHWVIMACLMGIMGIIGDITTSMFKRHYNVKDSSQLIPGHGGILDRIDSALRIIVIIYYYLLFFL